MARDVCKGVVKVLKVFNPSSLVARYLLGLAEVLKIFVVGMYLYWFRSS